MSKITKADAQEVLAHKYGVERARLDAPPDGVYAKPIVSAPAVPRGYRFRGPPAVVLSPTDYTDTQRVVEGEKR